MADGAVVAVLGPARLDALFSTAIAAMREDGHRVIRHASVAAFAADPAFAATAVVLSAAAGDIGAGEMRRMPQLRALVSPFIGTDGFDEDAATDLGILVANGHVPEIVDSLAEATVMLIAALSYDLAWSQAAFAAFLPRPEPRRAMMIRGKTLGLVGFGQIGQAVARLMAPWGVRLLVYARRPPRSMPAGAELVELDQLLVRSDIISVHAALTPASEYLIDLPRLRLLKPEAILVNTARGGIIDEAALAAVAREKPGLRIALDAFAEEPLPPDSPLRALPNAILTPHLVGATRESHHAGREATITNLRRILAGALPLYVRNPAVTARWQARFGER